MIAKGRVCFVVRSMSIHNMDPMQNDTQPISRYTYVLRETSKRRRQERKSPGKIRAVIGSQAHLRYSSWVIEGRVTRMGESNLLIIRLLQETSIKQCTKSPKKISIKRSDDSSIIPWYSLRSLRNLMKAIMLHTARISLMIQCPSVSQNVIVRRQPNMKEIRSITRTIFTIFFQKGFHRISQSDSEKQTIAPAVPITLPSTFINRAAIPVKKYAKTIPPTINRLNKMMNVIVMSQPMPPQDHARLYNELIVMITVEKRIRRTIPHSKGLQVRSGAQLTRYWAVVSVASTTIQLIWFLPEPTQLLLICTVQLLFERHSIDDVIGSHCPNTFVTVKFSEIN